MQSVLFPSSCRTVPVLSLPRLWTTDDFSYHGRFFSWDDKVTVVPRPVQRPHPPLWVAATQPETCRIAGEKGIEIPAVQLPMKLAAGTLFDNLH